MERTKKKVQWSSEETELLARLHPQFNSKKWKRISQVFHQNGFDRSQIECREKWINFLDPSINKKEWEEWQLQKLYEIHAQVGTRWCVVQKYIGRTQNKIKNRFYGTLRNYIRFIVKQCYQSNVCYNYQISKLSPKFLNDMYRGEGQFNFLQSEIKDVIYAMKFKIDKKILGNRIKQMKELYQKLNDLIFKAFEEILQSESRKDGKQNENQISSIGVQEPSQVNMQFQQEPIATSASPTTYVMPLVSNQLSCSMTASYPFENMFSYPPSSLFYWYM